MATILDSVKIVLGIESKGFAGVSGQIKSLHQGVERNLSTLKSAVAGYFTIAAGRALVNSVTTMAERWKDIAEQTGLGTDAVQKYDAAFKKVGLSAEDAAAAFEILTNKRREALEEGGASARLFQAFGISEDELRSLKSGAEVFERLSRGRNAGNQGDRELFGQMFGTKRAGKMLAGATALNEGGTLNIMSADDIKTIDDASKRFEAAARDLKVAAAPAMVAGLGFGGKLMGGLAGLGDKSDPEARYAGGVIGAMEDALRSSVDAADKQREFDYLKRTGRRYNARPTDSYNGTVQQMIASGNGGAGGGGVGAYSADTENARNRLNESVFSTLFKAGNSAQQKVLLREKMEDLMRQARNEPDAVKAAGLKGEAFKVAGSIAEMNSEKSERFTPDAMAAVGGIIGGAGIAADPGLSVAISHLDELKKVVGGIDELKKILQENPLDKLR